MAEGPSQAAGDRAKVAHWWPEGWFPSCVPGVSRLSKVPLSELGEALGSGVMVP